MIVRKIGRISTVIVSTIFINSISFAHWKVGSCTKMFGYSSDIQRWRVNAINDIRKGLLENFDNPHVIIDMSPFIPTDLEDTVAKLPQGKVGLYQEISPQSPIRNAYLTPEKRQQIPEDLWRWTLNLNDFVSELIREAMNPRPIYLADNLALAKVAIGGSAFSFTDNQLHVDTSFLSTVINVAGDIGTVYAVQGPKPQRNDNNLGFRRPLVEMRRAPPKSLIVFSGKEFASEFLGKPLEHRSPDKPGLSYRIIQFYHSNR